ncbi:MAG: efflux RND transporter permease subunit [Myxococcales bacterium]
MLAEFSVKRWQLTLVVVIALMALGVNSLLGIPKAEDPTFPTPAFLVVSVLPGASPTDLERLVVDPFEGRMKALENLKKLQSTIEESVATTFVEFEADSDPDSKHDEMLREMNALRPELPAELVRFDLTQFNPSNVNIVQVALVSDHAPYREIDKVARALKRRVEVVRGVDQVMLRGLPKQEVRVVLDLPRMVALGISPLEVINAIGAESTNIPAGAVEQGARRFNVKTSGDYQSVDEVASTVVRSVRGSAVRVHDVAQVSLTDSEAVDIARFDGKRAVLLSTNMRENENIFAVTEGIERELAAFAPQVPRSMKLVHGFKQAHNVEHRMSGFARDFALAIVLVLATLLPLGLRAAVVVMVSIPLSLALGLVMLEVSGTTINQLSIVGFVIALGLLVDDSVVVVENITRHLREGLAPRKAAIAATKQITASVLGCTATLMFAFMPLLVLPGAAGQFIRSLPLAVLFTIGASLLISLTVVPFLSSVVLKEEPEHGNVFFRVMTSTIERTYRPILARALAHPFLTLLAASALFAGSLALVPSIGFSLFPKAGTPEFMVKVDAAEGASLAATDRAARFVEDIVRAQPEVSWVSTTVGKGQPTVYYNMPVGGEKVSMAEVYVQAHLTPDTAPAFYEALRARFANYPGARITLKEFENGPALDAPIAMRLMGDDQEALSRAAESMEKLFRETPGTRDVKNPAREIRTDLRLNVDRDKAAQLGVSVADVDRATRLALGGVVAGNYRESNADDPYDIRLTLPRATTPIAGGARPSLEALDLLYVGTTQGGALPLRGVAKLDLETSPTTLRHYNRERSVTVTAYPREGFNTDRVTQDILGRIAKLKLPDGVRVVPAGEIESRQESFGGLGTAVLIAIFGVLAILVLEFRTFKSTLIVASVIPLGVVGGLAALYLSGYTLSFTANIGFVALMGIEVKNSILLVDFTNQLRREGMGVDEAIQKAGEARFVPILLTSLTAIGGLIPLVLERSALYSPLALVILGGLVSSTLLTRVVTPVLYKLLAPDVGRVAEAQVSTPSVSETVLGGVPAE